MDTATCVYNIFFSTLVFVPIFYFINKIINCVFYEQRIKVIRKTTLSLSEEARNWVSLLKEEPKRDEMVQQGPPVINIQLPEIASVMAPMAPTVQQTSLL